MLENDALIQALREALSAAPQNVILRKHLAELLIQQNAYAEAEKEYRHILDITPHDREVELALADAFIQQEKWMVALVILEKFLQGTDPNARVFLMSARAYAETGRPK